MPRDHIGRCKVQIFASRHPQGQNIQRFDANCQLVWKFRSLKIWWPHMLHKIEAMVPLGRQGASLWNSGFFLQNLTKTQDITNSQHSPCLKPRFGMYPIIWIRGVNQRALQLEVLGERSTTNNQQHIFNVGKLLACYVFWTTFLMLQFKMIHDPSWSCNWKSPNYTKKVTNWAGPWSFG